MPLPRFAPLHRGHRLTPRGRPERAMVEPTFEFGRYRVFPRRRQLLADGAPAELGDRAFDILLALIEANGLLVRKEELIDRVWHDRIVEENNLHVHISALRKALGGDRDLIRTEFGRGYRLTADVRATAAPSGGLRMTRHGCRRGREVSYGWSYGW